MSSSPKRLDNASPIAADAGVPYLPEYRTRDPIAAWIELMEALCPRWRSGSGGLKGCFCFEAIR